MARNDVGFMLRLPVELKDWLVAQASANRRSRNSEIVFRLMQAREADQSSRATGAPAAGEALGA